MATDRPRIQGYIDQEVYDRFVEWKGERGMSEALNQLLVEYFGVSQSPIPNPQSPIMTLAIQEMIEEACEFRFREMKAGLDSKLPTKPEINARIDEYLNQQFNEFNAFRVEFKTEVWLQLKKEFAIWNESLQKAVQSLGQRLEALEVLSSESPSESLAQSGDTRSPGQLPQDSTPGLEEDESSSADVEPDTEEELAKDSLADQPLPGELPGELGNNALARRLGVSGSTVLKNREKPNFEEWTRGKDPDAIAWKYDRSSQRFFPIG